MLGTTTIPQAISTQRNLPLQLWEMQVHTQPKVKQTQMENLSGLEGSQLGKAPFSINLISFLMIIFRHF